ncbi:hypothetical protein FBT96_20390 [Rhodobacter capsulatus]|uniref:Uncharacterized protein n=1 Tax=Rhodobacter capsulatus TaxID=1061 RepID=A0A4U1JJ85_RHOCA|nr:hypothetical protein [Rhodobacter capsulatus]TKD12547.1 hypothetical protein FBT96_20390 [Rhodobacter capsulatus]
MPAPDLIERLDGALRDISEGIDPEAWYSIPLIDAWACLRDGQIPRIWGHSNRAPGSVSILTGPILHITWDSAAVRALEGWYRLGRRAEGDTPLTPPSAPRALLSGPAFRARVHGFAAKVDRVVKDADHC